jgi:hypothetical protein
VEAERLTIESKWIQVPATPEDPITVRNLGPNAVQTGLLSDGRVLWSAELEAGERTSFIEAFWLSCPGASSNVLATSEHEPELRREVGFPLRGAA